MLINRANLAALYQGYNTAYQNAFTGAPSTFERIAMVTPSTTSREMYPWLGLTTRFREWIGDRVLQNLTAHNFTIENKSFENSIAVGRDQIADDQYGVFTPAAAQMGQDAKQHPDELTYGMLKAGTSEICYDGQYFFDTDHPVVSAGGSISSVSNFAAGSAPAWYLIDASRIVKPVIFQKRQDYTFVAMDQPTDEQVFMQKLFRYGVDARVNAGFGLWQLGFCSQLELTEANYEAARSAMAAFRGDNDRPLGITPNLLVVPPSLEGAARKIVNADANAAGATNVWKGSAEVLMTPYLA